jgi:hypothetical protein
MMFLHPHTCGKDGRDRTSWSLVETGHTPDGPRQRTGRHLGELNHLAQASWVRAIETINNHVERRELKLFPFDAGRRTY